MKTCDCQEKTPSEHLTLVYDVTGLSQAEIGRLIADPLVRYMAWGHIAYKYRELQKRLEEVVNET